jgi:hypothetical protein
MSRKESPNESDRSPGGRGKPDPSPARPVSDRESPTMPSAAREIGGSAGPEPTRYGDWEKNGRCSDF